MGSTGGGGGTGAGLGCAAGCLPRQGRAGSMSGRKKEVFIAKVLKKLYTVDSPFPQPALPKVHTEISSSTSALQQNDSECPQTLREGSEVSKQQKVYTVSLPPDNYVMSSTVKNKSTESDNTGSEGDDRDDSPGYHKRRRIRKKRNKSTLQCPNIQAVNHDDNTMVENLPLPTSEFATISKNKKRKLKKKRQKEKMKATGQLLKTAYVDFMYQPEEAEKETVHLQDMEKKAGEIQDFLQATKEIFIADSKSKSSDFWLESASEILQLLETRKMASSDMAVLHQLKSLIVLQDTERFHSALEHFKEHSTMPPEHIRVVCCLFQYWITDILPIKNRK